MLGAELAAMGLRDLLEAVSGRMNNLSILISGGEMKKSSATKPFLHNVHFLTYGHSKTFTIKEGEWHTQDFVGTVDFMKVYEQVRQLLRQRGLRGA